MFKKALIAFLLLCSFCIVVQAEPTYEDLHRAILHVEGWRGKPGDNGNAIGPYQIWRVYWIDATEFDKSIGGKYSDCKNLAYARKIVDAYFRRYGRQSLKAKNWQNLARIHNGGPTGYKRNSTLRYWRKVQSFLLRK